MSKYETAIKLSADETIFEEGSITLAMDSIQHMIHGFKRESISESPVAMRKFYRCVLAHLQTRFTNGER